MTETIYQYVLQNIDAHGRFTATTLCDEKLSTIPKPLGAEDAFYYTLNHEPNPQSASKIIKILRNYLAEPSQKYRSELYNSLQGMLFAEYCDPFCDAFDRDDMNIVAYDLARRFFYNAAKREQVKFAFLLFGLYGMEQIKETDEELWQNIVQVAHCEEFTFPFLFGCRLTNFAPHQEIWDLVKHTSGWGKVFSIIDCHCHDDEDRLWLLEHGPEIDVEYPPLAVKFITETKLEQLLTKQLTYEQYKGAVVIVGNYLVMLNNFPIKVIEENFNVHAINLRKILSDILKQAEKYVTKIEDVLDIITYNTALHQLADEQNHSQLSLNDCQLLIAACENIIYSHNWSKDIQAKIIADDKVNYTLCDFAYEMDIDFWPQLYDFWLQHPQEIALFPYLLSYEGDDRSQRVLKQIARQLPQYATDQEALMVPLRYLAMHPGEGEPIICASLTSIYDLPRGVACSILDEWGADYVTPAIYEALLQGRKMSNNDVVSVRIDNLLQGRKFDIQQFLKEYK